MWGRLMNDDEQLPVNNRWLTNIQVQYNMQSAGSLL